MVKICPLKLINGKNRLDLELECIGSRCGAYDELSNKCGIDSISNSLALIASHMEYQQQKIDELIQLVKSCDM